MGDGGQVAACVAEAVAVGFGVGDAAESAVAVIAEESCSAIGIGDAAEFAACVAEAECVVVTVDN